MSAKVVGWHVIEKDGKFAVIQMLSDGSTSISQHRFNTKAEADLWGDPTYIPLIYAQTASIAISSFMQIYQNVPSSSIAFSPFSSAVSYDFQVTKG